MSMPDPPGYPSPTPTPMPTTAMTDASNARADRLEEWAVDIKHANDSGDPVPYGEFSDALNRLAAIIRIEEE